MAKKDNSPAISFFSFQDIITSITGIMFLVVMMLVLMILNQSGVTGAEKQVRADLRQLNRELEELQSMVTQFEKTSRLQQEQITKLQQLKLETLPEKKRTLIAVLQDMDNAIRQAAKDKSTFLKLQEKERINGEKQAAETLRLAENNRQLEKTLLRQEKNHELYRKIMQMAWDKGNPKRPVFLECGKDSICSGTPEEPEKIQCFQDLDTCLAWCRTLSPDEVCFILLLKPSSFAYGEKLSRELQKSGYERGREVLPDETELFSSGVKK